MERPSRRAGRRPTRRGCRKSEHLMSPVLLARTRSVRGESGSWRAGGCGSAMRCTLPRAPANTPVLEVPSAVQVPRATRPISVSQTSATSWRTRTPLSRTIRRVPALVQLPGPQGSTERSWLIARTTVAEPYPSTVPLAVLISWKTPRSASRFVVDAFDSVKVALKAFPALAAPTAACSETVLPIATSPNTRSTKRVPVAHLFSSPPSRPPAAAERDDRVPAV